MNAAVPLAKRALVADNAKKLSGQTPQQLVSQAAEMPGPASSAAGLALHQDRHVVARPECERGLHRRV